MKRILLSVLGLLMSAGAVQAQAQLSDAQLIERALLGAPARARDNTAVVKWNRDGSYTEIKAGAGTLVCYDHSAAAGEQPFSVQCTHPGNLPRVRNSYQLEAQAAGDRDRLNQLIAAAEANGSRPAPVYGSPWIGLNGPDQASARMHMTIAVPFATTESTGGIPDNGREGGAWIMDAGKQSAHLMVPGM